MAYREEFDFGEAPTFVYWDTVDCPVPEGLDAQTVVKNIQRGLYKSGYRNLSRVKAYGNVPEMAAGAFATAGLTMGHVPEGTKGECRRAIFVDFMYEAIGRYDALNTMLILGDISENQEIPYAFALLSMQKNLNFLLAQPNKISKKLVTPVDTIWLWPTLSLGGKPFEDEEEEEKDKGGEGDDEEDEE